MEGKFCIFPYCITSHPLRQGLQVLKCGCQVSEGEVEGKVEECLYLGTAHMYLMSMTHTSS